MFSVESDRLARFRLHCAGASAVAFSEIHESYLASEFIAVSF